jgi:hypothetical protein
MVDRPEHGWMGYAVDSGGDARPGVPRARRPPYPENGSTGLPQAQPGAEVLSRSGLRLRTPVFGTAQPAQGLSGLVRRLAYRVPEHRPARWALLLAADRVDVLEHRARAGWWIVPAAAALVAGYLAVARLERR